MRHWSKNPLKRCSLCAWGTIKQHCRSWCCTSNHITEWVGFQIGTKLHHRARLFFPHQFFWFLTSDCHWAAGRPDPTRDSLPHVARVRCRAAEGDDKGAPGQEQHGYHAEGELWYRNYQGYAAQSHETPDAGPLILGQILDRVQNCLHHLFLFTFYSRAAYTAIFYPCEHSHVTIMYRNKFRIAVLTINTFKKNKQTLLSFKIHNLHLNGFIIFFKSP